MKLVLNKQTSQEKLEQQTKQSQCAHINQKDVKEIHNRLGAILEGISTMQVNAQSKLSQNRAKMWATLDENLKLYKDGLEKANAKRKDNEFNPTEKDRSNRETLETMSSMAQKIDEDNQQLMKRNQELKIQYMCQENDREMLIKQIIYHKKQN